MIFILDDEMFRHQEAEFDDAMAPYFIISNKNRLSMPSVSTSKSHSVIFMTKILLGKDFEIDSALD